MPDHITVDTADLLDAVRKAASVAAKRGAAFDKAAGIRFEHQGGQLLVKATDLDTSVRCAISVTAQVGVELEPFRLPSGVLSAYMEALPLGDDSEVLITPYPEKSSVNLTCGDCQVTLNVITGEYPQINAFEPDELGTVEGLASRLRQVSWAVDRDRVPLCGIHIDGKRLIACDGVSLAVVDCLAPVQEPLTAPLAGIGAALKGHAGDMAITLRDRKLLLIPDPSIQFAATTYAAEYPNVDKLIDHTKDYSPVRVRKDLLMAALDRIVALFGGERYPEVNLFVADDTIHMEARMDELGLVQDLVKMADSYPGELEIIFNPNRLITALNGTTGSEVTLSWPPKARNHFLRIEDGNGYLCLVAAMLKLHTRTE